MSHRERRDRLVDGLAAQRDLSAATKTALRTVPRHEFLSADRRRRAYEDCPLPIGGGQTVSAPHMVAVMADLLDLSPGDRVLEVGTGCGYHAAVTAELVGAENVYSVEYHDRLAERAREALDRTGYGAVSVRTGDGREGWPAYAPYDRVYLTCAAERLPAPLLDQLEAGGLVVAPVGDRRQTLVRGRKREGGGLDRESHGGVRFVPLQ